MTIGRALYSAICKKLTLRRIVRVLMVAGLFVLPVTRPAGAVATPAGLPAAAFDLRAALAAAVDGSTIVVPPGLYVGTLVVDKRVHLIGETGADGARPVIDGDGHGSVLLITASGAIVENLVIRNSGNQIDKEDAGIVVENAEDVQLIGNRIEDVLYGVRAAQANGLVVRGNHIVGRKLDVARRGDGMRLWQSTDSLVEDNTVEQSRDVLFWFSDNTTVRNNHFKANRYGIHMMYTDGMQVVGNALEHNSVGAYLMYSTDVLIAGNTLRANRGPSGYGVALKDMDAVTIHDNYFLDNRVGLFFDNSPARVEIEQRIERNVLAYNDIGVLMMPAVQRNVLRQNAFIDNLDQVGVKGGGSQQGDQLSGNHWDGNYWSDYVGYDSSDAGISDSASGSASEKSRGEPRDGIGDLPYRAESLFENLAERYPDLQLFHFSPIEGAIDLAAQTFPIIKPKPKLTDATPLMAPVLPQVPAQVPLAEQSMGWLALGLLLASGLPLAAGARFWSRGQSKPQRAREVSAAAEPISTVRPHTALYPTIIEEPMMITVSHLYKRYPQPGRPWWSDATVTAVDDLSFDLARGHALALWGSNGAGKTTVLKCLLGLLSCSGELHINGVDLRRDGCRARQLLGYVPQELAFHVDLSVLESCRFYARLKRVSPARIPEVLAQVGLANQLQKRVGALSGGMKQRLALALALLSDPPVLLLDEPTSNLDAATRADFLDLLVAQGQAGKALLFTSHQVAEVEQLADQVLLLENGRCVAQGTPLALMSQLVPERTSAARHIKVIVAAQQQPLAQEVLTAAGYAAAPNGHGIWVAVAPERKAEPITLLHHAAVEVLDVEM